MRAGSGAISSARRYVYVWADGVYLQARMEPHAECMLVLIGATPEGKKELVGFQVGMRESAQSWRELLVDIKARGLAIAPELAIGDGALGFWKAIDEAFADYPPSAVYGSQDRQCARTRSLTRSRSTARPTFERFDAHRPVRRAETAIDVFAEKYGAKYEKAVTCLTKDRDALLDLLRLPRGALGSSAHVKPDRERVRDGASSNGADQGRVVAGRPPSSWCSSLSSQQQKPGAIEGRKPVAEGRPRRHIPKRRRGHRNAGSQRRLIDLVTQSPA